jgi:hypothetical protein
VRGSFQKVRGSFRLHGAGGGRSELVEIGFVEIKSEAGKLKKESHVGRSKDRE